MIESIINWMMSYQFLVGAIIVAVLDLVFAMKPEWLSNGILHSIYVFLIQFKKKDKNDVQ